MKRRAKFWLILLVIGLSGIALITAFVVGTGRFTSYQASETYLPKESFMTLEVEAARALVTVLPSEGAPRVEVFAKAWLPGPIDLAQRFSWAVEGEKLVLREIPFESTFLGFFPQPYEMTITAYVPQAAYDSYMGGRP